MAVEDRRCLLGNMTSSKSAKICKVSQDTASREIAALVSAGMLRQVGRGRSTHYELTFPGGGFPDESGRI